MTNHDTPTLRAWWNCQDIDFLQELGIYEAERCQHEKAERHSVKVALLNTLAEIGELPSGIDAEDINSMTFSRELMERLYYYLVRSNAKVTLIQLEDCMMLDTPVNVPGTS